MSDTGWYADGINRREGYVVLTHDATGAQAQAKPEDVERILGLLNREDLVAEIEQLQAKIEKMSNTGIRVCDKLNMAEDEIERLQAAVEKWKAAHSDAVGAEHCARTDAFEEAAKAIRGCISIQSAIDVLLAKAKEVQG